MQTELISIKGFVKINKQNRKRKNNKKEEKLQISVAKYIRAKYPDVIFQSDIASGMKLPIHIAAKCKSMRSERGLPDLMILEPVGNKNAGTYYAGLMLELKNNVGDVYLKDGKTISDTKSNKHILEQAAMLKRMREKGYFADFSFGLTDTINKVDVYMNL